MGKEHDSVTVRVPATSANIGSGFDTLGLALDLWNELIVTRSKDGKFHMVIEGEGENSIPCDETNLVCVGLRVAFDAAGKKVPPLTYICKNKIPFSRGLGSSSAAIVSGIVAGLVLAGHELAVHGEERLLQLAAAIEGHPDNVAPAIYGGMQLGLFTNNRWYTERINVPAGLQCVLFIPDKGTLTSEARALLPKMISREDAVFNMARVGLLIHNFSTGQLDGLRIATEDRLHQQARSTLIPHLLPIVSSALQAGAHGAFLSGAGPTILAFASGRKGDIYTQMAGERNEQKIADAMLQAAKDCNCKGSILIVKPTEQGAYVVTTDPPPPIRISRL